MPVHKIPTMPASRPENAATTCSLSLRLRAWLSQMTISTRSIADQASKTVTRLSASTASTPSPARVSPAAQDHQSGGFSPAASAVAILAWATSLKIAARTSVVTARANGQETTSTSSAGVTGKSSTGFHSTRVIDRGREFNKEIVISQAEKAAAAAINQKKAKRGRHRRMISIPRGVKSSKRIVRSAIANR